MTGPGASLSKFLVFTAYLAAAVLMTWPLVLHLNSSLFGDGYGDAFGALWSIWARNHGFADSPRIRLIAAPFGMPNINQGLQPLCGFLADAFARVFGDIAGCNAFALSFFPLTAWATFLFLNSLLKDSWAAFFGGLMFGFCPAAVIQAAGGHGTFSLNFFIPLLLWSLFHNRRKRSPASALFVGISYALLTLLCAYWGYFGLYAIAFFSVLDYGTRGETSRADWAKNFLIGAAAAILLVSFFERRVILQMLTWSPEALAQTGRSHDLRELVTLSARPWEYLIPSIDHPVFGPLIEGFMRRHLHGSNLVEQTIYLGFTPAALCAWGLFLAVKKRLRGDLRAHFLFFIGAAAWTAFLSAPPYLPLGTINLPTVSGLVYALWPMARAFRAYVRFGIWTNFFTAAAAAVVLAHLRNQMPVRRFRLLFFGALTLIGLEYWGPPPLYSLPAGGAPPVYLWLARRPGDFIVAEYPMMPVDEAAFQSYLFWQRVHKKRLVNGALPSDVKAWDFYRKVRDLAKPDVPILLRQAGIRYVIVHDAMYAGGQVPGPIKKYFPPLTAGWVYGDGHAPHNPALGLPIKKFGSDQVFDLSRR